MRKSALAAGIGILALTASLGTPAQAHRSHDPRVVADGLAGALTLDVADRGDVLVTQSFAGILSRVDARGRVTDLHQLENPEAGELVGVARDGGTTYHIESDYSGEVPTSHVVKTSKRGTRTVVSEDLWAYEIAKNPDGARTYGFRGLPEQCAADLTAFESAVGAPMFSEYQGIVESHAYQLDVHRGNIYVADAAANAILEVNGRTGAISTAAVLPATTITFTAELEAWAENQFGGADLPDCLVGQRYTPEPVPTDVRVGHDGRLYVSTLQGGAGEAAPLSTIYRIDLRHGHVTTLARGLHGATGLALMPSGDVVVAEMFDGEVSLVRKHGRRVVTLFTTDTPPADVDVRGRTIYTTTADAFGDGSGALLRYEYRGR